MWRVMRAVLCLCDDMYGGRARCVWSCVCVEGPGHLDDTSKLDTHVVIVVVFIVVISFSENLPVCA